MSTGWSRPNHLCLIVGCGKGALRRSPFCAPHRFALNLRSPVVLRGIDARYPGRKDPGIYLILLRQANLAMSDNPARN